MHFHPEKMKTSWSLETPGIKEDESARVFRPHLIEEMVQSHGALENPVEEGPDRVLGGVPELLERVVAPVVVPAIEEPHGEAEAPPLAVARRRLRQDVAAGEPVTEEESGDAAAALMGLGSGRGGGVVGLRRWVGKGRGGGDGSRPREGDGGVRESRGGGGGHDEGSGAVRIFWAVPAISSVGSGGVVRTEWLQSRLGSLGII